jgi:hypothetical protein
MVFDLWSLIFLNLKARALIDENKDQRPKIKDHSYNPKSKIYSEFQVRATKNAEGAHASRGRSFYSIKNALTSCALSALVAQF